MATFVSGGKPTDAGDPAAITDPKFISQIKAGNELYDIATHHSIKFFNGSNDATGTSWNGVTELQVVIPSIADLVTDPIKLVGIADKDGTVKKSDPKTGEETVISQFYVGDLVFIGENGKFYGNAVEAGDMAIYDGKRWYVVTGENQVSINGIGSDSDKVFSLTGTAATVLTVEGKTLSLAIDYSDVATHVSVSKNTAASWDASGKVTVDPMYVTLSKGNDKTQDISTVVSLEIPTTLASGLVTISDKVFASTDFHFNAGTAASATKNTNPITCTVDSSGVKLTKVEGSDYITGIDGALKSVAFGTGSEGDGKSIKYATLVGTTGGSQNFVSGIHAAATDAEKADGATGVAFVNYGAAELTGQKTFYSGISATEAASGDFVSSVAGGAISKVEGSDFLTGLGEAKADGTGKVITGVSFGTVTSTSGSWFLSGWEDEKTSGYDFVTSISLGDVKFTADAAASLKKSAVASASVSNNVLIFTDGDYMQPVTVSRDADTIKGRSFTKAGAELTGTGLSSADFTTTNISHSAVTVSYKSFVSGTVGVSQGKTNYFLDSKAETIPSVSYGYSFLDTTAATVTSTGLSLGNSITVTLPSDTVYTTFTAGSLPTLTIDAPSREIGGLVGTTLTSETKTFLAVDSSKKDITIPGAYSLVSTDTSDNAVAVAKADTYDLSEGKVTVAASMFVTDVTVKTTA